MGVNSLPKTVTRQRRDCDLNPGLLRLSPARSVIEYGLPLPFLKLLCAIQIHALSSLTPSSATASPVVTLTHVTKERVV